MGRRKKTAALPPAGAAFAVPLENGRFGVCRVIRTATAEETKLHGEEAVLLACSAWMGAAVPAVDDPALRPILYLTHHSWKNKPEILWVSKPPPDDFISIGMIEPTAEEKAIECLTSGGWGSVQIQPIKQWRWDNERELVLEEDQRQGETESQKRQRELQKRQEYLDNVTLDELRDHKFFPRWDKYPPKKAVRASRQIMADTVQELIDSGADAPESIRMAILQKCIERFNSIDEDMNHFIETVEREDICEEFEAIVHACGLGSHKELADEWREW